VEGEGIHVIERREIIDYPGEEFIFFSERTEHNICPAESVREEVESGGGSGAFLREYFTGRNTVYAKRETADNRECKPVRRQVGGKSKKTTANSTESQK
jgi:hypothetical protein